ncbi:MAG: hypothetical protein SCALA702_22740 [Melioribacteraceae bacterium]|nr:MAG: hypothetical protein SCALA702_22740 [Melioribacteraceae bacterium]
MTNAQKWVAVFLVLFVGLYFLSMVTGTFEEEPEDLSAYADSTPPTEVSGAEMVKNIGCISCHGADLNGTKLAPAISGLSEYWTRDELINYLRNPSEYDGGERFDDYRAKYPNIVMPSYGNYSVQDLGKIADYLLSKE